MKKFLFPALLFSAALFCGDRAIGQAKRAVHVNVNPEAPAENRVIWTSLGKDENDSMPLGNGKLATNVWTEKNGNILLLLAHSDAWAETGNIIKLGRVRLKLSPNPFADTTGFTQTLNIGNASIELKKGNDNVQIWIDANNQVMHVVAHLSKPSKITATVEPWRKITSPDDKLSGDTYTRVMSGQIQPKLEPDVLFDSKDEAITWCHFNADSYYPYEMKQEHLESLLTKYPDPLLHRSFGAKVTGTGLVKDGKLSLKSTNAATNIQLNIFALAERAESSSAWHNDINAMITTVSSIDLNTARLAHNKWWQNFWGRSWIQVSGAPEAANVSQGYKMQRYMMACSSRGELPTKFNGGIFTVGHDLADTVKQTNDKHNADYRAWGESFWNQNNRLLYWPLIATGDTDLIKPWFAMYLKALPFQLERNKLYYGQPGASFPETMHFWGLPRLGDFGKDNPTNEIQSRWQKYHVQGSMEVIAQMLDDRDHYGDAAVSAAQIVLFADAIITYYDQHWPRDANGKILMSPMQSLETYQLEAVNPTPDIAGLMSIIPRLLKLPAGSATATQMAAWSKTLKDLPPIPLGKTAKGKLPPLGVGDADGLPTILPAEKYGKSGNSENPELYVSFPYRLYGVGKPNLQVALNAFAARRSAQNVCWGQDGTEAAVLGLTDVAKKAAVAEFNNYGDQRFKWFWRPGHDWIPDLDNGGSGMITLQAMLMQCDDKRIQLLPSWPADWTADFKLNAPYKTTVEGHVENGKVTKLVVTPVSRAKDVEVVGSK